MDQEENTAGWIESIKDALRRENAELADECAIYDSVGDMMYGAGNEFFVAIAGNNPDDTTDRPIRSVMVVHVRDLISMASKVLTTLRNEGKFDYLQSLGVPVVDMSIGDDSEPTLQ